MLYVPLDFKNGQTIDAPVDSGAYVNVIAQIEADKINQQATAKTLKVDDHPIFQTQLGNGQLEKPLATATVNFTIGDNAFAEHFNVMEKLSTLILGLHSMSHYSVVIGTTHGFIPFPHLTMQVKSTASMKSARPQYDLTGSTLTIPTMTTKTYTNSVDHPLKWNARGTVPLLGKVNETADFVIFLLM